MGISVVRLEFLVAIDGEKLVQDEKKSAPWLVVPVVQDTVLQAH